MMEATMAEHPSDLRYTKDHEWLRPEGARWRVGITRFAAEQIGDVVMVELPAPGTMVERGEEFGTVESVKAVSPLYAPVSGKVVAVNEALKNVPELVNNEPFGGGWMIDIEPSERSQTDELLTADAYGQLIASAG
jgi:glycine cleavage system H protein